MSDEPKCWWRYNRSGGTYMTCEANQKKSGGKKPPKQKPRITLEQFKKKYEYRDGGYSSLSEAQQNEYHKIDMYERRAKKRELVEKNTDEVKKITKKHYADEAKKRKETREEKLKRKKEFSGDRLNEYLRMLKALDSAGNKLPKKNEIKERVGEDKYQKLMKKYKDAVFK